MLSIEEFKDNFCFVRGKTIAMVYIFEGDISSGFSHFFIWKSNILTKWMNAIQELHCLPLILDVRTFVDKAINKTLPHIDYVLNMNSGTDDLSSMALVPATCSSIGVPCIPCNAVSIVTGENKLLSNLIAKSSGLNVPSQLSPDNKDGIFRPINLGNSLGVIRGFNNNYEKGIYQQFIHGYDITTPVVYNAITQKMDLLPTVMYLPDCKDTSWFNGENEKITRKGYKFRIIDLDQKTKEHYLKLVDIMSIQTFCRIDARVECKQPEYYHNIKNNIAPFENVHFIEINVMPTIRYNNNFNYSFDHIDPSNSFYSCVTCQKEIVGSVNLHSFLLASSMLSFQHSH